MRFVYKCKTFDNVRLLFSMLYEEYPNCQIQVELNSDGSYTFTVDKTVKVDCKTISVPLQVNIDTVYGDTDSIMCRFTYNRTDKDLNRQLTFQLGRELGDHLTKMFNRPPIEMEFEKIMNPFILIAKKMYISKKFEDHRNPFKCKSIDNKGIAVTKRDYCPLVRKTYQTIINFIMNDGLDGIKSSIYYYNSVLSDIVKYKIEWDDLLLTKQLAKTYKNSNLPHVHVAQKLRDRNQEVHIGDRIPFVYVEIKSETNKLKYEFAEDPLYAKEHNLKMNRKIYFEHIIKPIQTFYNTILKENTEYSKMLKDMIQEKKNYIE